MFERIFGQSPAVRSAVFEWLAAAIVGFVPLLAHGSAILIFVDSGIAHADWTPDVVFAAIAISGAGPVSAMIKFCNGSLDPQRIGRRALVLVAGSGVLLTMAGIVYGAVASDRASSFAPISAWGLLIASIVVALALELTLAAASVERSASVDMPPGAGTRPA